MVSWIKIKQVSASFRFSCLLTPLMPLSFYFMVACVMIRMALDAAKMQQHAFGHNLSG